MSGRQCDLHLAERDVSQIEGGVWKEREGQRSQSQPCIDLCGDHTRNGVFEKNDDDDNTLLLLPRGTG